VFPLPGVNLSHPAIPTPNAHPHFPGGGRFLFQEVTVGWLDVGLWRESPPMKTREELREDFLAGSVILRLDPLPSDPGEASDSPGVGEAVFTLS